MAGGVHGRGCVIVLLDYCIVLLVFNMHGRGRAWLGVCMARGVCGRGHAWQGVCVAGGMRGRVCVIVLLDYCIVLLVFNMRGKEIDSYENYFQFSFPLEVVQKCPFCQLCVFRLTTVLNQLLCI